MKKYLEKLPEKPKKTIKHCVYMNRIQKRIERELDMLLWLAIHYPEVFLDEEREWKEESGKIMSHRRLKKLLLVVKALNPKMEVELVLKQLDYNEEVLPPELRNKS
jgi:hypothetical protein